MLTNTQLLCAGALSDGRKAVKWATDYFLKAHVSANVLYGQVGEGGPDHAYWGRPEDMTMSRPAFKIDTSRPGKLASKSFFSTPKHVLSVEDSAACETCPRIVKFESSNCKTFYRYWLLHKLNCHVIPPWDSLQSI
jgi:hypothetical protein